MHVNANEMFLVNAIAVTKGILLKEYQDLERQQCRVQNLGPCTCVHVLSATHMCFCHGAIFAGWHYLLHSG